MTEVYENILIADEKSAKEIVLKNSPRTKITHVVSIGYPNPLLNDFLLNCRGDEGEEQEFDGLETANEEEGEEINYSTLERTMKIKNDEGEREISVLSVRLEDSEEEDLLSMIGETNRFISSALLVMDEVCDEKNGNINKNLVLVHCNAGVSRSVSIVLAYILWQSNNKRRNGVVVVDDDGCEIAPTTVEEALKNMREKYARASPNEGFYKQLELWSNMGCRLIATDETYKLFKYSQLDRIRRVKGAVDVGLFMEDPELELQRNRNRNETNEDGGREERRAENNDNNRAEKTIVIDRYYSCRKCRRVLATNTNVLEHEAGKGIDAFSWQQKKRMSSNQASSSNPNASNCSSVFVSPVTWMLDETEQIFNENSGKIHCPKCQTKIGAFAWSGERCSCGAFVCPSFQLQKGKLDLFFLQK